MIAMLRVSIHSPLRVYAAFRRWGSAAHAAAHQLTARVAYSALVRQRTCPQLSTLRACRRFSGPRQRAKATIACSSEANQVRKRRCAVDITLQDGRELQGKLVVPMGRSLTTALNGGSAFVEFELPAGERMC